jgi:hypothetical protein
VYIEWCKIQVYAGVLQALVFRGVIRSTVVKEMKHLRYPPCSFGWWLMAGAGLL